MRKSLKVITFSRRPDVRAHRFNDYYFFIIKKLTEQRIEKRLYNGFYLFQGLNIFHLCYCVRYLSCASLGV